MSQIAQLSESEIEDRFFITGKRPVQFLIQDFAEQATPFTVQFDHGQDHFLSLLLGAPQEDNRLFFDCSGSPETNQRFLRSEHNVFVGRPGGIHVQFATGPARLVSYDGNQAFAVALPDRILRLQRREYFRIETPRIRPPEFFGRLPDGTLLSLPVHDLSCHGIGLTATTPNDALVPGLALANCRLVLPEDSQDLFMAAEVRHLTPLQPRSGNTLWRVGLEFRQLGHAPESRIQRYIAHVEHERRELLA